MAKKYLLNIHNDVQFALEKNKSKLVSDLLNSYYGNQLTPVALVGEVIEADTEHEAALDDTIRRYHAKIRENKIPVTLTGGLQAIKIKSEIQKNKSDTKIDLVKLFAGMSKDEAPSTE